MALADPGQRQLPRHSRECGRLRQPLVRRLGAEELVVPSRGGGIRVAKHGSSLTQTPVATPLASHPTR
jgi:hypothetical protein